MKMFKFSLVLVLLAVNAFKSVGQQTKDTLELPPPPQEYLGEIDTVNHTMSWQNDEYRIKLFVPFEWRYLSPNEGEIVSFSSVNGEILAIRPYKFAMNRKWEDLKQGIETDVKSQFPNMKFLGSQIRKIDSLEILDIAVSGIVGKSSGIYRAIHFNNTSTLFILVCFYTETTAKTFEKSLDGILKSIRFY